MTNYAVPASTTYLSDTTFAGHTLPTTEAHTLATFTGFTFTNSPEGLVVARITVGSAGAGTATVSINKGTAPVVTLADSTAYILGPFDPTLYSNLAGLVTVTMSVVTGNYVGLYLVPAIGTLAGMRALHDPFNQVAGSKTR